MGERSREYQIEILGPGSVSRETASEVRIYYAVDGVCTLRRESGGVTLEKSDILLLNHGERGALATHDASMAAVISIEYYSLWDALGSGSGRFSLDSRTGGGQKYVLLRDRIQELLLACAGDGPAALYREREHFNGLMELLISNFLDTETPEGLSDDKYTLLMRCLREIHASRTPLSLKDLSERLYMSQSAVSRFFQKATGENFVSYVRRVRLEKVKRELAETDKSVTVIAVDHGFSSPSTLNKIFKSEFGMTPTEYREANGSPRRELQTDQRSRGRLLQIMQGERKLRMDAGEKPDTLHGDLANLVPWENGKQRLLTAGPVYALRGAKLQRQLLFLKDSLDAEYIRIWDLYSERSMLQDGRGGFNFTFVDEVLDFFVDNKLKVFLDLSLRTDSNRASEKREVYANFTAIRFQTEADWENALRCFLEHILWRYSEKVVREWVFELSFFLKDRPYYESDSYSSKRVWNRSYELIKSLIPAARVAGPGLILDSTGSQTDTVQSELLVQYFLLGGHPPDIFTSIHFPYFIHSISEPDLDFAETIRQSIRKSTDPDFIADQIALVRRVLTENGFAGEYWVTEWGYSVSNRNYVQDSCFRAAYTVENALRCQDSADSMGIFTASDLINEFSDSSTVLYGGAGLLSRGGICKPVYYAFQFLSRLGRFCILQTENCIVTAEHPGDIRILCANLRPMGPKYYLTEENSYRPQEISGLYRNRDGRNVEIFLECGELEGVYTVRHTVLNEKKGSVLDRWVDFGCAADLTRGDLEYLERVSTPEITVNQARILGGVLGISFQMEPNEVRFIRLTL